MDSLYIQKVIEGDINAFRYLVDKYKDMSFSISYSIIRNEQIAEENVQDSFLKAFQALAKFKGDSKFSTWLYKIVVNGALRKIKKKSLDTRELTDSDEFLDPANFESTLHELSDSEQKKYINSSLSRLNERESLLLRLFYLNENSIEEIKEITNLSISNIKVILYRARSNFYKELKKELRHEINSIL
ncbi:MAG: sigma-70 family RNA polymerase sigma factor [Bacteroidales bacterium]|nr:sigma-70 family RNA polymerase sigma factor [Bacteroidales bacterium]